MSALFQSLRAKNIYFHWKESRRKIMDGWILLSLGIVIAVGSLWIPSFTLILIGIGALTVSMGLAVVLLNFLSWRAIVRNYRLSESFVTINTVTQKLARIPVIIVYNHDNPNDAVAVFSPVRSYIIPISTSTNVRNAVEQLSDEIKRLLPYPWQDPVVLETVTNAQDLDARIQQLTADGATGVITNVLMDAAWRFAKVTRYFLLFGQPLPQVNTLHATPGPKVTPAQLSPKNKKNNQKFHSPANYQRYIWPVFICLFLMIGFALYYFGGQMGPTKDRTYLDEFQIMLGSTIPLEYHSYIGLGRLEQNPELNVVAETFGETPLYEKVGGGNVISTAPAGTKFNVVQEENAEGAYWYYVRKSGTMGGWTKGANLKFDHLLPAGATLYVLPFTTQPQFSAPDRAVPYAIKRIYHFKNQTWWEIWTFSPLSDSAWLQKGEDQ